MDPTNLLNALMGGGVRGTSPLGSLLGGLIGGRPQGGFGGGLADSGGAAGYGQPGFGSLTEMLGGAGRGGGGHPLGALLGSLLGAGRGMGGGGMGGGMGGGLGGLLGGSGGGGFGPRMGGDMLGQLAGGLFGGGGRMGGGLGGGLGRMGGMAVLGGLAAQLLKMLGQAGAQSPEATAAALGDADKAAVDAKADLMVRAMIEAAKADGIVDDAERASILGKLGEAGLSDAEKRYVEARIAAPADVDGLIAQVHDQQTAAEVFTASLLAIQVDTDAERHYLQRLAERLGLEKAA